MYAFSVDSKLTVGPEVLAAVDFKMLLNFYQTIWHNIPEDSHLHTHCCENLKSHLVYEHLKSEYADWIWLVHDVIELY
jgi:hypothetical protein